MRGGGRMVAFCGLLAGQAACGEVPAASDADAVKATVPVYEGASIVRLDEDLVSFVVSLRGAAGPQAVTDYARCIAAGYTRERGFGFARHLRTNVAEEGGVWVADAVYTISPALPKGLRTIDAEVAVADCAEQGIPTV